MMIDDPFGGPPVVACRALIPDVALIHAHRADRQGNVQYDPTAIWPDLGIFPKAARKVIVTRRGDRRHGGPAAQPRPHACYPGSSSTRSSSCRSAPTRRRSTRTTATTRPCTSSGSRRRGTTATRPSSSQRYVSDPADQVGLPRRGRRGGDRLTVASMRLGRHERARRSRRPSTPTDRVLHRRAARHHAGGRVRERRPGVQRDGLVHPGVRLHAGQAHPRARPGVAGRCARPRAAAGSRCRRPHWKLRCGATPSCTSSSTATSGPTRSTADGCRSSASAPPSSTSTATPTTR